MRNSNPKVSIVIPAEDLKMDYLWEHVSIYRLLLKPLFLKEKMFI